MKLLQQTTCDTKTKTNKLQSVNPSVSCIVQHKKPTLTLNLLELWCKLKTKRESEEQRAARLVEKTWVASQEREGKKWPHQWEEATENIRKQLASLVHDPPMWLESTSYRHGYRKLVKDVFFFRSQGVGRGSKPNTWGNAASDWPFSKKGLLGALASRPFSSLPSVPSVFWIFAL